MATAPLKSAPQSTGKRDGLSTPVADGLANVASGLGTARDRTTANRWTFGTENAAFGTGWVIDSGQIEAAYRTSWLVRKVHDLIPAEMTKEWRSWSLEADAITKMEAEEKRLKVKAAVYNALRLARLRGGAAIIMGLPGDSASPAPENIQPGQLLYLFVVTRDHLQAQPIVRDLLSPLFGQPASFRLSAGRTYATIHPSRVLAFPGMPSGGLRFQTEEDEFWGRPLMESINDALQDATVVTRAIAALIPEAKADIISIPGLTDLVSTQLGEQRLAARLTAAQTLRSMFHALILDGGNGAEGSGETWETRQLDFKGLPEVGRFMLQVAAGACDIPLTRLIGAPPEGMNATGEHDEKNFLRMIKSRQETDLRPSLETLDRYLLRSAGVKPDATWQFSPLQEMDPEEQADLDAKTAETFDTLKKTGLIQDEALAEVMVAVLADRKTFPGLDTAVQNSSDDIPAKAEREALANAGLPQAANSNAARNPRAAQGPARVRRVTRDQIITDAAPRSLYISRKVMNPQEILNHFRAQGIEGLVRPSELHVSVMTATNEVDWMALPADWSSGSDGRMRIPPGGPRVVSRIGTFIVQEFASDELGWRFDRLVSSGLIVPRFPDFRPHISLVEDPAGQIDPTEWKPYIGRIVLGPEIFEEVI